MDLTDKIQSIIIEHYPLFKHRIDGTTLSSASAYIAIEHQIKKLTESIIEEILDGKIDIECPYCKSKFNNKKGE